MNAKFKFRILSRAFTLAETLAALVVSSMVLIIVLAIYSRAQTGADAVFDKLENNRLPREVLQRIAEDLDSIIGPGPGARITIANKYQEGLPVARMEIVRVIGDSKEQSREFDKVIWQSSVDPDSGLLTLYRSHSGIALEDKLLDEQKKDWERALFVPICTGLSFFRIEIPRGDVLLDRWTEEKLPAEVTVTLSFAEPYKTVSGVYDVAEQDKLVRVIAIDRTRKLTFTIPAVDANKLLDANLPFDANRPAKSQTDITDEPGEDFEELIGEPEE